ncbi:MAG: hypothetical protein WCP14_01755 [bacterium]
MLKVKDTSKNKINWRIIVITVVVALVTAGAVGGGVWYNMDQNEKNAKTANEKELATLKSQIKDTPTITPTSNPTPTSTSKADIVLTDSDYLNFLTINKSGWVKTDSYVAPIISKNDGTWAITSPLPILYDTTSGYHIPGMGGSIYVWHKVSGSWEFVGQGGEGGYDDAVKAVYSQIPITVIPESSR